MKNFGWYGGKLLPIGEIRVPLSDRSVFFGDAIYDAMIGTGGKIHLLSRHLDRFFGNAEKLGLAAPERDGLATLLLSLAGRYDGAFFLYVQLSRKGEVRKHAYDDGAGASLLVTLTDYTPPEKLKTISLLPVEDLRYYFCDVKTVDLLPSVLAAKEAERAGADEAVFHRGRVVTECAHSNISILKGGRLLTHPADRLILRGIARERLIAACDRIGIPTEERPFSLSDLFSADEILVTSTSKFCERATRVGNRRAGGKNLPLAEKIFAAMREEFPLSDMATISC